MSEMKILHYTIKYQDRNIAIVRFLRKEILDLLENSKIFIETGEDPNCFWECLEEALIEIFGVLYVIIDGYEITIIKNPELENWSRVIENVIWCSVLFLNPDGGAIEVSKYGRDIGKLVTQRFDTSEPEYPRLDKK